ncbi:hypothetical protein M0813_24716 [Anaeramoeba flamelloides]|uniref:Uncharacterized protein n=1 Tax=Anaeramoeba flamelloides TaxID=1746091 RepID=A0AAV7ZXX7_9EUKA|nr:hypothetical protein M0812_08579 [Anaeramoeba flamelloides]KAJ6239796.1 hypothetical protein M0813_24716 [Anaeramoeba flamelloides]
MSERKDLTEKEAVEGLKMILLELKKNTETISNIKLNSVSHFSESSKQILKLLFEIETQIALHFGFTGERGTSEFISSILSLQNTNNEISSLFKQVQDFADIVPRYN